MGIDADADEDEEESDPSYVVDSESICVRL